MIDWKNNNYNSLLVIANRLTKIVYYKPVNVIIDALDLAKVIINIVMRYHDLPDLIVTN